MEGVMDKSLSETDVRTVGDITFTTPPPSFAALRGKRKRDDDITTQFEEFKEEMKKLIAATTAQVQKIAPALSEIQKSNQNIENSLALLTAQNEEYKKKIENLEAQRQEDRQYISILEEKIEDMQKGLRKSNFEIKNVPRKEKETKEDLVDMVVTLSKNIGCEFNKTDIKDIYRVRGKREDVRNTPIIVETASTLIKNDVLKMSKAFNIKHKTKLCAKHLGFRTSEDTPVFVSENLTARASRLHFLARDFVKTKAYKYCWTAYGKVYVRKDETSPVVNIKNELQIQQLLRTT